MNKPFINPALAAQRALAAVPVKPIVEKPPMTPIPRKDRIYLACSHFGLYILGMAINDSERVDEDCAMDNMRVPYYMEQLTEVQRVAIAKFNTAFTDEKNALLATGLAKWHFSTMKH